MPMVLKKNYIRDGRAPIPKDPARSRIMSAIGAKNTGPEMALLSQLKKAGIRGVRRYQKNLPGRPDISLYEAKIAIFVNGCYWHRCPYCKKLLPKQNRDFWRKKFEANVKRDSIKARQLRKLGWRPLVIWECRLKKNPTNEVRKIIKAMDLPKGKRM